MNSFNAPLLDEKPAQSILPLYGGAEKPLEKMTVDELEEAASQVYRKVREAAFSRGLPVIIKRNGQLLKEYADGHTEPLPS
ncbi:hypothetical protein FAES_4861 [Fibrella aestuarina BUZ 2]|uniref:Uncharacterized protein n=1 Tax=Fibrella aestuarina BUZ 2 TaxID=1166018 RepID=I0KFF7_9BACT|nr:hypothetical protein [Fibrella aestuarina]CCH02860.1 hypothetical protein FAES_4861 [Fibrella aestuarina BUZ 2]